MRDKLNVARLLTNRQFQWTGNGHHSQLSLAELGKPSPNRVRQLYKNISMLFLFPVKDGKLSIGVNATFNASCYG